MKRRRTVGEEWELCGLMESLAASHRLLPLLLSADAWPGGDGSAAAQPSRNFPSLIRFVY